MKNRYLCKAKRTDNGEWVIGGLVRYGFTGREKYYIVPSYASDLYALGIDPSTICRCTGLKDKNGKLIWENDMVKGAYFVNGKEHRFIGKVGYVGSAFKVVGVKQYSGMRQELHSVYAIIGNIFDNPELLA